MKHYSVKGTPDGFQVNEDENGDWVSAEDAQKELSRIAKIAEGLAVELEAEKKKVAALEAGESYADSIREIARSDMNPLELWAALSFANLPQKKKNEVYVAFAEGCVNHDKALKELLEQGQQQMGEFLEEQDTSIEKEVIKQMNEEVIEKTDKEALEGDTSEEVEVT
jgi:hypothetical protein